MTSLRSDAATRRGQLLDAADAVFEQHGITAPLELVIARAGVGRATLYRNFPDRTALIEALLWRAVARIEAHVQQLGERDDAFFELLAAMAGRIVDSPALADHWRAVPPDAPAIAAARQRVRELMTPALERAVAAGLCHRDLAAEDIALFSSMLGAALRGRDRAERARLAERALQLILRGLRPPQAST